MLYTVYGEEEYLAGADAQVAREHALAFEQCPSQALTHGRGLRRIACATALTGTVGAVGGVVGLAGLRTHAHALDRHALARRELARRVAPPAPVAAALSEHPSTSVPAARGQSPDRRQAKRGYGRPLDVAQIAHSPRSRARTSERALTVSTARVTGGHRSEIDAISDRPVGAGAGWSRQASSPAPRTSAEGPSPAPQAPPETEARPAGQSEFGFER